MKLPLGSKILLTSIITITLIMFLISGYVVSVILKIETRGSLCYIEASENEQLAFIDINYAFNIMRKEDIKERIDNAFNNPLYIYQEKDLEGDINGRCNMFTRVIEIEEDLTNAEYIITLTHELVHLTTFITDESLTQFKTFKKLYNSKSILFNCASFYMINMHVLDNFTEEYDVEYYIYNYLEEVGDYKIKTLSKVYM